MTVANKTAPAGQPWAIRQSPSAHTSSSDNRSLAYGNTTLPLNRVDYCRLTPVKDWDVAGQHFNFMIYVAFAAAFLFLIVEAGWRIQFFAAITLFLGIGAMSLADVCTTKRIHYFRVEIHATDGNAHTYTTASQQDAQALIAAMASSGVSVRH